MRFVVDPVSFRSTTIAPSSSVHQPKRQKRTSSESVVVPRAVLPTSVINAAYKAALKTVQKEFRRKEAADVAKAFWAAKRLEDIRTNKCPCANGVLYDDETACSTLYHAPFPFASSFFGDAQDIPVTRGAEDPGAVVFARSRCANTENGPTRFHVRLSIFNNDSVHPLHLLNTHLFIVTQGQGAPTLTEMTSAMPIVNEPIRPTKPEQDPKGAQQRALKTYDDQKSSSADDKADNLSSEQAAHLTLSSTEFDVVIPVEEPAVLRGVLYYCHMPAATTVRSPTAPAGKVLGQSVQRMQEALATTRHPGALDYHSLRALSFGPLRLDPEVTNYVKMSEWS